MQLHKMVLSRKDTALLNFAHTMVKHEKEWASWHKEEVKVESGSQTHYYNAHIVDKSGKSLEIRQDVKSPYYRIWIFHRIHEKQ